MRDEKQESNQSKLRESQSSRKIAATALEMSTSDPKEGP